MAKKKVDPKAKAKRRCIIAFENMSRIDRRQFLKRSALTAAGLTLSRSHAFAFTGVP